MTYTPDVLVLGFPRGGTRYMTDLAWTLMPAEQHRGNAVIHEGMYKKAVVMINPWGDRNVEAKKLTMHLVRHPLHVIRSVHTYYTDNPHNNYRRFIEAHNFRAKELQNPEGFAIWWCARTEYLLDRCDWWGRVETPEVWWDRFCWEGFEKKDIPLPQIEKRGGGEKPYLKPELAWEDLGEARERVEQLAARFGYET
jgi:hypothetical protein